MTRYRITAPATNPIILGFLRPQDQVDIMYDATCPVLLEADEHTIWAIWDKAIRHPWPRVESITTRNAIDLWLEQGKIMLDNDAAADLALTL